METQVITTQDNHIEKIDKLFSVDGAYVNIPDNTVIDSPIVILYATSSTQKEYTIAPENNILIGKNSKAHIIEIYLNQHTTKFSTAAQTTIHVDENANLEHTILQQSNIVDCQHLLLTSKQQKNSQVNTQIFTYGGKENRIKYNHSLVGNNAVCNIKSLEYTKQTAQHIFDLLIEHKHPNTASDTVIRSVLDNSSKCCMHGKIIVSKDTPQVKANLQHKTILLSEQAKIDSKPELEIYNDDVSCSHGSTIGKLDMNALLYMNSRGISTIKATQLLLQSFISPIIDGVQCSKTKQQLRQLFLPGAPA